VIYAQGISEAANSDVVRNAMTDLQVALAQAFGAAPIAEGLDNAAYNAAASAQRAYIMPSPAR
jgi:hypothetical protein